MATVDGLRRHKLMTAELRRKLPPLYHNEGPDAWTFVDGAGLSDPFEAVVQVKLFSPYAAHRWYVTEFDGEDVMFGYAVAPHGEWGYSSLAELSAATLNVGRVRLPAIERDLSFEPKTVREAYRNDYGREP